MWIRHNKQHAAGKRWWTWQGSIASKGRIFNRWCFKMVLITIRDRSSASGKAQQKTEKNQETLVLKKWQRKGRLWNGSQMEIAKGQSFRINSGITAAAESLWTMMRGIRIVDLFVLENQTKRFTSASVVSRLLGCFLSLSSTALAKWSTLAINQQRPSNNRGD